jgi:hypothetical protein
MHSLEGEAELEQLAVIGVGYADLHAPCEWTAPSSLTRTGWSWRAWMKHVLWRSAI